MRRRAYITLLGVATGWPLVARAQQPDRIRRIGVLMPHAADDPEGQANAAAFAQGLQQLGWIEGRNVRTDTRWAAGNADRFRDYAAELVGFAPDLIVAVGTSSVAALKQATRSIPIIFTIVNDPVAQGFISSMAQPGGNITGFSLLEYSVLGKELEMLKQVAPNISRVGVMFNPETYPYYNIFLRSFETTAPRLSVEVAAAEIRTAAEIEEVISQLGGQGGTGVIVAPDPFTSVHRGRIITWTAHHRLPAIYSFRRYVQEGALMSYGADPADIMRRSVAYVDRIFKGANPAELPAQQPTQFELAINLKTAKSLALTIPSMLLAAADEVIE
jgi:putative ABC transport system substrate-binding protein